ncbi:hypothetical protein OsccyDRAFT_2436 [Leptolyngbyaceae cyanobacterium JSC-12]|nr:hypothetical protein OsccyDRAFT_2436 [Leptolyngbyaceae cyanobacterium JSC-12]
MDFLTSTLLAGVLLTISVMIPPATAQPLSANRSAWQLSPVVDVAPMHVVKTGGQPKHRGSGRRELVNFVEPVIG